MIKIKNILAKIHFYISLQHIIKIVLFILSLMSLSIIPLKLIQISQSVSTSSLFDMEHFFTENEAQVDTADDESATPQKGNQININTASLSELMTLPNIGKKRAEDVIALREQGAFESIEDIKEVKGIGEKTYEKLESMITVS